MTTISIATSKIITIVCFRAYDQNREITFVDDDIPARHIRRRRLRAICPTAQELSYVMYEAHQLSAHVYPIGIEAHPQLVARNAEMRERLADVIRKVKAEGGRHEIDGIEG